MASTLEQVRAIPVRKDDEVTVVRGTYKVRAQSFCNLAIHSWGDCTSHHTIPFRAEYARLSTLVQTGFTPLRAWNAYNWRLN